MTQNKARTTQAHLLGLPRELRDEIYGYVFDKTTIDLEEDPPLGGNPPRIHLGGLNIACKQLYCETNAHFRQMELVVAEKDHLLAWLRRHKSQLCLLPYIKFSRTYRRYWIIEDDLTAALHSLKVYDEACNDFVAIKCKARDFGYPGMQKVVQVEVWTHALRSETKEKVWTTTPETFRPAYKRTISWLQRRGDVDLHQ